MICPNCIEKMEEKTKHLGRYEGKRIVLQCPKCGWNVKKSTVRFEDRTELEIFYDNKQKTNDLWKTRL